MKALPPFSNDEPPEWVLSFDFDGTLVDHEAQPQVQPDFFHLIESLRDSHRALWGVNTGRPLQFTLQGMLEAKFTLFPDFIIAREREIYLRNEFGRWVGVAEWNKGCDKAHRQLYRKSSRVLKKLKKWVESETAAKWGEQEDEPAGIVATTHEEMETIVQKIDTEIHIHPLLSYQRNSIYLRFSHGAYHKGSALTEMARLVGLGVENIFTIGDGHNDLDMLNPEIAKHFACPANAYEDVKDHVRERGGYIARGKASEGVVEALKASLHSKDVKDIKACV
ncbi:MAG: HAD family hydrolase [Akkermansiaceae bacterium]